MATHYVVTESCVDMHVVRDGQSTSLAVLPTGEVCPFRASSQSALVVVVGQLGERLREDWTTYAPRHAWVATLAEATQVLELVEAGRYDALRCLVTLHEAVNVANDFVPMYVPRIAPYVRLAHEALDSGWVSNQGAYVDDAARELCAALVDGDREHVEGARELGEEPLRCVLMANGTAATHCLFLALRFAHPDIRKVYVPNNVYVAVWNCALCEYEADQLEVLPVCAETWNFDMSVLPQLEAGAALVLVHNVGSVIDVDEVRRARPDLVLVEDNCEGLFGRYPGRGSRTGSHPAVLASSCSFYANKTITTGEGGAFFTRDRAVYEYVRRAYSQGMTARRYVHDMHAYNYRMTNVQAALLLAQLRDLPNLLRAKRGVWDTYERCLGPLVRAGKVGLAPRGCAQWMFAIRVPGLAAQAHDHVVAHFRGFGCDVRPFFYPVGAHKHLEGLRLLQPGDPVSGELSRTVIMLPSYPDLTETDIRRVARAVAAL